MAQQTQWYSNNSNLSFRVILSSPTHFNIKANPNYFDRSLQKSLFNDNTFVGLEANYFFRNHWAIASGVFFTRSSVRRNNSLEFYIAPPPGTISFFYTHYHFFSASFEPNIKFSLDYHRVTFFWSAGPVLSYAALSSQTDAASYGNPDDLSSFSNSKSHIFGVGGTVSTGVQYGFTKHLGLSLQVEYKYVHFPAFPGKPNHLSRNDSLSLWLKHVITQRRICLQPLSNYYESNMEWPNFG